MLLLPMLAAALTLWSISDRSNNFDKVPAAIVNLDAGATMVVDGKEMQVPLGRELVSGLMYPKEDAELNLGWQIVTEETARAGLDSGEFEAVVTIPKTFSENVASMGTPEATPALITVTSNDASSEVMGMISSEITAAAAAAMGHMLTEQMLDQIFLGFNDFKDQLEQAADGAGQLDEGAKQLGDGAGQLSDGVSELSGGAWQLADGLGALAQGTGELAGGVDQLYGGLGLLSAGADGLADGTKQLRDGFVGAPSKPGLKTGIDQLDSAINSPGGLAEGTVQLADGASQLNDGIDQLVDGLQQVLGPLADIEAALPDDLFDDIPSSDEVRAQIERIREILANSENMLQYVKELLYGSDAYVGVIPRLQQAVAECPADSVPQYCALLAQAVSDLEQAAAGLPESDPNLDQALDAINQFLAESGLNALADQLVELQARIEGLIGQLEEAGGFEGISSQLEMLRDGAAQLSDGVAQLRDGVNGSPESPGLSQGISQLADGAAQLQGGLDGTPGQPGLVDGARQLADGIRQAMPGLVQLRDGTWALADGANQSATGASQLADGTSQLAGGASALYAGIGQLIEGTTEFATQLGEGVDQVPAYTEAERTRIVSMGAIPVKYEDATLNEASSGANSLFPWAAAIVLWLGAFGVYLAMPGLRRRELASSAAPVRVAWNSFKWAALLAIIQVVGVIVVSQALGVRPNNLLTTTALLTTGALSFALINQALLAVTGARVGRILALLFLVVQVVSLGGVFPIQTAPAAFQAISNFLPLSALTQGLTHTVVGGNLTTFFGSFIVLAIWGGVSFLFTTIAASKARRLDLREVRRRYAEL